MTAKRRQWPRRRRGAMVPAAAMILASAAAALAPARAAPPTGPAGLARPGTLRAGSTQLESVFCTSRANCWAVGLHTAGTGALVNEIVHWNGQKWSKVRVPSPVGTSSGDVNTLSAVRCTSAANCWAVGQADNTSGERADALHWNGTKWAVVPTPEPGGTGPFGFTLLRDVTCTSARSCWAVGWYGHEEIDSLTVFNLALHWNGRKWFKVATPSPAGTKANDLNDLNAVRCTSPSDCWAAGTDGVVGETSATGLFLNDVLHWNGKKWSTQAVPNPGGTTMGSSSAISGLSCTSVSNCWAVGAYGQESLPGYSLNEALHWNGRKWFRITTPNPDGTATGATNVLNSVNCIAKTNCWAVGKLGDYSSGGAQTGQALHWNGTKWTLTATPDPAGTTSGAINALNSVRCVSAKNCWIVGYYTANSDPDIRLFLHWNGVKWSAG